MVHFLNRTPEAVSRMMVSHYFGLDNSSFPLEIAQLIALSHS
jgi:hypothetical protein